MLTVLFFIIVGFYLFGLLGRLFLNYWIRKKQREFAEGGGGFSRTYMWGTGFGRSSRPKPEGDVTVRQTASAQKKVNRNVGDSPRRFCRWKPSRKLPVAGYFGC